MLPSGPPGDDAEAPAGLAARGRSPPRRVAWSGANMQPKVETTTSKRAVLERQVLGVALDPLDLDARPRAALRCASSSSSGVMSRPVTIAARRGRRDRGVAGAAGDVEHALALLDADPRDEVVADLPDPLGDRVEVARRPGRARSLLSLGLRSTLADPCRQPRALRQLLLQLEHRREEVAVLRDPLEHLGGLEAHRLGVAVVGELLDLVPGQRRRRPRPLAAAQRVDGDRRLRVVVLAPVDEDLALAQLLRSACETTSSGSDFSSAWATARA